MLSSTTMMCRNMKAVDMESGKVTRWQTDAHEAPINCILPLSSGLVASGDDDGCVKLWDGRQSEAVAEFSVHTDFVTDFAYQVAAQPRGMHPFSTPARPNRDPISACCTRMSFPHRLCRHWCGEYHQLLSMGSLTFILHMQCILLLQERENCLVATSADATVSITDLRTRKVRALKGLQSRSIRSAQCKIMPPS